MLRLLSSPKRLCDGLPRRDLLQIGSAALGGLGLSDFLTLQQAQAAPGVDPQARAFGRAKHCIVLFLYGSPSQLETFDMKPEAPIEIRGTMRPIATSLPGLDICEHLPQMAKIMDRTTIVRSMAHRHANHCVSYVTTGNPVTDTPLELSPYHPRHHPYFGSCVEYVDRRQREGGLGQFVQNVGLPFPFSSKRKGESSRAGPYAAYLGGALNPLWTEFVGAGTTHIDKAGWQGLEPYVGCSHDSHFRLAAINPAPDLSIDRLDRRRDLLSQLSDACHRFEATAGARSLTQFQSMAYDLIGNPRVGAALDVRREPDAIRDLYGMTLFGQSCLAARRLIEAGTRLVSVFWDEYGIAGDAWDTHVDHFPRMIDQLCPGLDRAISGLVLDLEQRGLFEETLIAVISEHGRTPRLDNVRNGGRNHWA